MTTNTITAHATAEIGLSKLVHSSANVRRTGADTGIEALAASIEAHGLLQSLVVRPRPGAAAQAAGRYEVVAGGRRLAALRLLAKKRRLPKDAAIPCRVLDEDAGACGAAEASLAENTMRQDMHPADQFEAFHALHRDGAGLGVEEIAARFAVSAHTVRQRLRLAAVSPALVQAYRDGALTLDHLMAYAVSEDREAQERVHGQLSEWQRSPETIRRLLTNALVPATDRRVLLVSLDAYLAAGGTVQRDLFSEDRGGWIGDAALLERLVAERIEAEAGQVRAEGWRWVGIGPDAAAEAWRLRRVPQYRAELSEEDQRRRQELAGRYDELAGEYGGADELPEEVAAELAGIERELGALEAREEAYRPEDVAVAGAVLLLAEDGTIRVKRGYVRPKDEPAAPEAATSETADEGVGGGGGDGPAAPCARGIAEGIGSYGSTMAPVPGGAGGHAPEPENKGAAISAMLEGELEAHRTAGLQAELTVQPGLALRVLLHALATDAFYAKYLDTACTVTAWAPNLTLSCRGIADSPAYRQAEEGRDAWRKRLPGTHGELWGWLLAQDDAVLMGLLAVCVARVSQAGGMDWTGEAGARSIAAQVAQAAGLDMRRWWTLTPDSYLARVPKAAILDAVRDGAGEGAARRIAGTKKEAMVQDAAVLLDGKGWLPARLRVPGAPIAAAEADQVQDEAPVPGPATANEDVPVPPAFPVAAE